MATKFNTLRPIEKNLIKFYYELVANCEQLKITFEERSSYYNV